VVRSVARSIFLGATVLLVVGSIVQVFLAGRGVFEDQSFFISHRDFGYTLGLLTLVILIAAIVGRMGRTFIGGAVVLMVLFALQSVFVAFRDSQPAVAALHPLNGFFILLTSIYLSVAAWRLRKTAAKVAPTGG
jgi:hypothetical protein